MVKSLICLAVAAVLIAGEVLATRTTREALDAVRSMQHEHEPLANAASLVLEKLVAYDRAVGEYVQARSAADFSAIDAAAADGARLLERASEGLCVQIVRRADGSVNLARVYFKEGRLDEAVAALQRAVKFDPPAPRWTVEWFNGLVNKQNGFLDQAITDLRGILEDRYHELDRRGFDFSSTRQVCNGPTLVTTRPTPSAPW